jgi:capsular exopolysaccharide synthesis family protein
MVANLGIIMAQAGYRTIIVDADLRQPAQHHLFHLANSRGLVEAIRSPELDLSSQLTDTQIRNLQVLTSGEVPLNPAELLGSQGMRQVLASLSQMADVVICDSPPALGLSDTVILANRVDGVLLVIEAGRTHLDAARRAISNLQQANANLIGVILNRGRLEHQKYYTYHYNGKPASSGPTAHTRSNRRWQWLPF